MRYCIIPARGGSKRIPRKNIKLFRGTPMIVWSIKSAISSLLFDQVIVSTDDPEIAEIAQDSGAHIPFLRSPELSTDHVHTLPVIKDMVQNLPFIDDSSHICCLYACAPFANSSLLTNTYAHFINSTHQSFSFIATHFSHPIQRALFLSSSGLSIPVYPAHISKRTQDLPATFHDTGQLYWGLASSWCISDDLLTNSKPYIIPHWSVQDIDTFEDWNRAELLHKMLEESPFTS